MEYIFYFIGFLILYTILKRIYSDFFKPEHQSQYHNVDSIIESEYFKKELQRLVRKFIAGELHDSIAIADSLLEINPNSRKVLIYRANALSNLNFNLDAIDDYENALTINDFDGNTHGLLGLLYRKIGENENGDFHLQKAVEQGYKQYQLNIDVFQISLPQVTELLIAEGKKAENNLRRNKSDFEDSGTDVDEEAFKIGLEKGKDAVRWGLSLDPDNEEIKWLHKKVMEGNGHD